MKTVVLCVPDDAAFFDPDPAVTHARDVRVLRAHDGSPAGVVGWSTGGWAAVALSAGHPELVERLVLVSTPLPEGENSDVDVQAVRAKTLLLFGSADPLTGWAHGRTWQRRLADARLEMVPGAGHDILIRMWPRILSYLAPRSKRG